jgi:hypothetical protein
MPPSRDGGPMARRTFDVIDICEIFVHWHAGRSKNELAASLGLSRNTVRRYLAPAEAAGMVPGGPALSQERWAELAREWFPEPALCCSRLLFVRPVIKMDQRAWTECHAAAFAFFGGVPARLVPDRKLSSSRPPAGAAHLGGTRPRCRSPAGRAGGGGRVDTRTFLTASRPAQSRRWWRRT